MDSYANLLPSSQQLSSKEEQDVAEIDTSINYELDTTVHNVTGNVTPQEILDKLEKYYQGEPTTLILWDFTNASMNKLTIDELKDLVRKAKKYSRNVARIAMVFSTDMDFKIGRMLGTMTEIEGYDFEFNVFRKVRDAREWLAIP